MARRRYISTTMAVDKRLNQLALEHGDFAALLYTWMIPHAEDDGGMNGDLDEFMATVIPMRRDKSLEDVRAALLGMAELGLIEWDGECCLIQFPSETFYRHQSYITAERRRVAAEKRESARIAAEQRASAQNAANVDILSTPDTNSADQRKTPQNAASSSSSFKSSSLLSPDGESAPAAPPQSKPLPLPKKTTPTEEWAAEMRQKYRLRDFDETLRFHMNGSYYRTCADKCTFLEKKLEAAAEREAGLRGLNGNGKPRIHPDASDPDKYAREVEAVLRHAGN